MTRAKIFGVAAVILALTVTWAWAQGPVAQPTGPVRMPTPIPFPNSAATGVVPTGPTQFFPSINIPEFNSQNFMVNPVLNVPIGLYGWGWGWGNGYGNGYGYGTSTVHYVVAVKRGYDITWQVFPDSTQAWNEVSAVRREVSDIVSFNAALKGEVASLKRDAARLRTDLTLVRDPQRRADLEDALGQVEQKIVAKESQAKPDLVGVIAGPFYSQRSLDTYLIRVEREAYDTRLRAPAGYAPPMTPTAPRTGY